AAGAVFRQRSGDSELRVFSLPYAVRAGAAGVDGGTASHWLYGGQGFYRTDGELRSAGNGGHGGSEAEDSAGHLWAAGGGEGLALSDRQPGFGSGTDASRWIPISVQRAGKPICPSHRHPDADAGGKDRTVPLRH